MSAKTTRIAIAVAVVAAAAFLITRRYSTGSDPQIVVGVLAPKTGFMSGHGESIEMGARVAERIINERGGVNGQEIRLVVLDTASDPATTAERTKELIERHKANLLIGTGTSASTLAAIPPATQSRVPFIYSLDGECKTCAMGDSSSVSNCVYGSGFTERMIVEPFLKYLHEKFGTEGEPFRVYYVGGDYVYPRTTNAYAKEVAERLGFITVGEEYSDTSTQDYTPVIRRIREARPSLLIVTNPGGSGVTFMRQAIQLGLDKEVVISGFATFDQEAIDAMGDASEGVYAINRYSMRLDNEENKRFIEVFREMFPNKPLLPGPTAAAGSYGSLMLAASGFENAQSTEPDAFFEAMQGLEMELPQGRVRLSPINNVFEQHVYVLRIHQQQYEIIADLGMQKHPGFQGCSVR
ncbi:MAG: ABC transporter substrate-binding protein [Verrucomicrobiota bacterium]